MINLEEFIERCRGYTDSPPKLEDALAIVRNLKLAIGALEHGARQIRQDFHSNTCEATMGCHCTDSTLDIALNTIKSEIAFEKGEL